MATATKSRREEYSDATRGALIEAAREIFTERGYQATGIEAIARSARVTRGAFYHHFADKKALFDALVVELQQRCAAQVVAKARLLAEPWDRLVAGCHAFLEAAVEPGYQRLAIQEAPAALGSVRCREIGEAYPFGLMINALGDLKAAGVIEVGDPRLAGRMIGAMICEAALLLTDSADSAALKREADAIVERTLGMFRT
jgi:AcrR family transcriptional regulator